MEPAEIALVGLVLIGFALVSRRIERWPLTMPMVFVGLGALASATSVVEVSAEPEAVGLLAEVTLAVILFGDAVRIDVRRLRAQLALPARLLGVGLPLTIAAGTIVNRLIFEDLSLALLALLAAVLAPTDAALGSAVVEDESVPARERLALNVESGLNDGMVVPVVALFAALATDTQRSGGYWVGFVAEQIGWGVLVGAGVGAGAVTLLRAARRRDLADGRYVQLAAFSVPIVALCGADAIDGNGFIAAFVAGIAFGSVGPGRREAHPAHDAEYFAEFTDDAAQLLGVVAFFVFGNLFVGDALGEFGPAVIASALLSLTLVRIVPVWIALLGTGLRWPTRLFVGWFGPRGLASIVFGILLLEELEELGERTDRIVGVISLTVTLSVLLHGATAAAGARRYGRWASSAVEPEERAEMELADLEHPMPRSRWARDRDGG